MRKTFFTKTNVQMLTMSFVGLTIMLIMSLYVGASLRKDGHRVDSQRYPAQSPSDR